MNKQYKYPVKTKELEQLLKENPDDVMWKMKVRSRLAIINFILFSIFAIGVTLVFFDLWIVASVLTFIIPIVRVAYIAHTMKYTVFPDRIRYEWGILAKKVVDVPFNEITAINHVSYTDSKYSTVHFGTSKRYKVPQINFNKGTRRHHITFEDIADGEKVIELLNLLWNRNTKSESQVQVNKEELNDLLLANPDAVMWNMQVRSEWNIQKLVFSYIALMLSIYFSIHYIFIAIFVVFVILFATVFLVSRSTSYTVFPNKIRFQWGVFNRQEIDIPFEDITAINLVGYKNSDYSTIHFGTKSQYKINKFNFDSSEPSPHITFENVKNGQQVYNLLNTLWERSKKKSLTQIQIMK